MTREDGIGYCPECGRRASWVTLAGAGGCDVHGRVQLNWERPLGTTDVRDFDGNRIAKGQRIVDAYGREIGTVILVTEPDGDWSDHAERAVAIGPFVDVEYDAEYEVVAEAKTDRWIAFEQYERSGEPKGFYVCDDVVVKEES